VDATADAAEDVGADASLDADAGPPPEPLPPECTAGPIFEGDAALGSQREVDAMAACREIEGSLRLSGDDIADLRGLSALQRVGGTVEVAGNAALESLEGLASLREARSLRVTRNFALRSMALPILDGVANLQVTRNPLLTTTGERPYPEGVTAFIVVERNALLTSLTALGATASLRGNIRIERNGSLATLEDLASLTSVGDRLVVIRNARLPQADAELWAAGVAALRRKVDGNQGAPPPAGDCPWTGDADCDEPEGTGLCVEESDAEDCAE